MVPEDHTKYVNPKLFEVSEEDIYSKEEGSKGVSAQGADEKTPKLPYSLDQNKSLEFKGIPYTSIISEWWRRNGGEPAEGERNVKLHKLAVNLRAIFVNSDNTFL